MRRAITTVENAHLAIFVVDGTDPTGAAELLRRLKRDAGRVKPTEVEDSGSGEIAEASRVFGVFIVLRCVGMFLMCFATTGSASFLRAFSLVCAVARYTAVIVVIDIITVWASCSVPQRSRG